MWYYEAKDIGYNYRLNEISSALGNNQLNFLNQNLITRERLVKMYHDALRGIKNISLPNLEKKSFYHAWHLFSLKISFQNIKKTRGQLMKELMKFGIGSQVHYIPLFYHPLYRKNKYIKLNNSIEYYNNTLSLPLYIGLKKKDIDYICEKFIQLVTKY